MVRLLYETLSHGDIITKRDIYYRDVALFKRQSTVDQIIDVLCESLQVELFQLGCAATQKGLLYGDVQFLYGDGTANGCKSERLKPVGITKDMGVSFINRTNQTNKKPSLIPLVDSHTEVRCNSEPSCVIVVEKEVSEIMVRCLLTKRQFSGLFATVVKIALS